VSAANFRIGHQIQNQQTGEQMEVTGVDATGLVLTVYRRAEWAQAASFGAVDTIIVIGNINAEGADTPQSIMDDPTSYTNFTQIFRSPLKLTGTAANTALKYDRTGPMKAARQQALMRHSIEMEKAFIEGIKLEWTDPSTGELKRTTGGIISHLPAAYKIDPPTPSAITSAQLEGWFELVFRVCSNPNNEKLALVGSGALMVLNRMAETLGTMETMAADDAFGMSLTKWHTPFGVVFLRTHPLFTSDPMWRYRMLILDVHNLVYRHVTNRDTTLLTNRQGNGRDARVDEYLTECGLEVHHFGTGTGSSDAEGGSHLLINNMLGAGTT
jgi:hypothetical protein